MNPATGPFSGFVVGPVIRWVLSRSRQLQVVAEAEATAAAGLDAAASRVHLAPAQIRPQQCAHHPPSVRIKVSLRLLQRLCMQCPLCVAALRTPVLTRKVRDPLTVKTRDYAVTSGVRIIDS